MVGDSAGTETGHSASPTRTFISPPATTSDVGPGSDRVTEDTRTVEESVEGPTGYNVDSESQDDLDAHPKRVTVLP